MKLMTLYFPGLNRVIIYEDEATEDRSGLIDILRQACPNLRDIQLLSGDVESSWEAVPWV